MHGGWPLGERGGGGGGGGGGGAVVLIPNWEQLGIGNFGDKLGASWGLGIGSAMMGCPALRARGELATVDLIDLPPK